MSNKEEPISQRLDMESLKNYDKFIWRQINWRLSSKTGITRDKVYGNVMDGLLKAIEGGKVKALHGSASVRGYIYNTTRNKCHDYLREITRAKKRLLKGKVPVDEGGTVYYESLRKQGIRDANEATLTEYEIRRLLMRLDLDRVSPTNLQVLIQVIQKIKPGEIADNLNLTKDQARGRIARVRRKITDPAVRDTLMEMIREQRKPRPRKKWHKEHRRIG